MISGEDKLTVDMKYRDAWSGKLGVRFTMLSNELPKFGDESGALASRFLILTMVKSFLGEEDIELYERLLKQLPAILNWSLDGLDRLRERGRFVMPAASAAAVEQLEDLTSPVSAFARAACRVGVDPATGEPRDCLYDDVYAQYVAWSELNGSRPSSKTVFTSDMTTAFPELVKYRPRTPIEIDGEKKWKSLPHRWKGIDVSPEWIADRRADAAEAARRRREDEYADHGCGLD